MMPLYFLFYKEETDCLVPENKRSRLDDVNEESPQGSTTSELATAINAPTTSQDDVMIVGDVQVGRPEVIDLERLPTIRQGTSNYISMASGPFLGIDRCVVCFTILFYL